MKDLLYSVLDIVLDILVVLVDFIKRFFTPKRIVKIIIIVIVYKLIVYYLDARKVNKYQDRAEKFITLLEERKPYQAQAVLGKNIQKIVSIEEITELISNNSFAGTSEIDWGEWSSKKGYYLLNGIIKHEEYNETIPVTFLMSGKDSSTIKVLKITIGESTIRAQEDSYLLPESD